MKKIIISSVFVCIAVLFFQCRKELSSTGLGNQNNNTSAAPITSTLQGNVLDENGQPAIGVSVTVNNATATTDSHGYFRIVNASLDKNASLVIAQKTGYFKAYRTFRATSGVNQVEIQLIKRTLTGTVSASSGGAVTLSNGAKVSLPANGVVIASNNTAYSGTINVYASYIDPTNSDINKTIPGSFTGNDKNGNRVALSSYGMLVVELETSSGQKLQIASNNQATLTTPIPSSLQGSAAATISLWYVNEQTGIWQEEGTATKNGTNYIGNVKHFSYWNCDYSVAASVSFTAAFKTSSGLPLAYTEILVAPQASGTSDSSTYNYYGYAHGYTDSLGQVNGFIPANLTLAIKVIDNCGNIIYSQNTGPFTSDNTDLGTITIPNSATSLATIKGKLVDCNNNPVTNGLATIYYNGYMQSYVACNNTGDFSTSLTLCSINNSCQIIGTNQTMHQQGNVMNVPITSSITNAGNIIACGTSVPFYITLTGKLVDCNNQPVANGAATINYGYSTTVNSNSAGDFSARIYYTPDSVQPCQVTGINITSLQEGNSTNISIASLLVDTLVNVGNIVACGTSISANMSYTIDGINYALLNPISYFSAYSYTTGDSTVSPPATSTSIYILGFPDYVSNNGMEFIFTDNAATTGVYPIISLYVGGFGQVNLIQPFNVTLTSFAQNIGDVYQGNFSGQFKDSSGTHTITCSFNQQRTQ